MAVIVVLVGVLGMFATMYRLPTDKPAMIEGNVVYKSFEFGNVEEGIFRSLFEYLLGYDEVRVGQGRDNVAFYVPSEDAQKLKATSLGEGEMDYSFKVRLQTYPLLFGGYGPASVLVVEKVPEPPFIYK